MEKRFHTRRESRILCAVNEVKEKHEFEDDTFYRQLRHIDGITEKMAQKIQQQYKSQGSLVGALLNHRDVTIQDLQKLINNRTAVQRICSDLLKSKRWR